MTLTLMDEERMAAAVDLIKRTGAQDFQLRYSDEEEPTVWMAVAHYTDPDRYEVAAAMHPPEAVFRLCDQLIDGGICVHCHRPAGFNRDPQEEMPLAEAVCWYQYYPEKKAYERDCRE